MRFALAAIVATAALASPTVALAGPGGAAPGNGPSEKAVPGLTTAVEHSSCNQRVAGLLADAGGEEVECEE
jgi:hypothetical protein